MSSIYLLSGRQNVLRHFTDEAAANAALAEERKRDRRASLMTVQQAKAELDDKRIAGLLGRPGEDQRGKRMTDLQRAQAAVGAHLTDILAHFKDTAVITVIVRTPQFPDRDFVMTNDTIAEAREALNRREREAVSPVQAKGTQS